MRVALTPQAAGDLEETFEHYAEIDSELGERFVTAIDVAMERIRMFPLGAPPIEGFNGLRRARMRHFPYGIFYQPTEVGDLLVVRVLNSRRQSALRIQDA